MNLEQLLSVIQFGTYITLITNDEEREFKYDLSINSNSAFIDFLNYTVRYIYVDNNRLVIEI